VAPSWPGCFGLATFVFSYFRFFVISPRPERSQAATANILEFSAVADSERADLGHRRSEVFRLRKIFERFFIPGRARCSDRVLTHRLSRCINEFRSRAYIVSSQHGENARWHVSIVTHFNSGPSFIARSRTPLTRPPGTLSPLPRGEGDDNRASKLAWFTNGSFIIT
jgi:hypothetical protein